MAVKYDTRTLQLHLQKTTEDAMSMAELEKIVNEGEMKIATGWGICSAPFFLLFGVLCQLIRNLFIIQKHRRTLLDCSCTN